MPEVHRHGHPYARKVFAIVQFLRLLSQCIKVTIALDTGLSEELPQFLTMDLGENIS